MLPRLLSVLVIVAAVVGADSLTHHKKRDVTIDICEQSYNAANKIQCFCIQGAKKADVIISAECHLTVEDTADDDPQWQSFQILQHASRVVLSTARNIALKYIPTKALSHLKDVQRLEIKYGKIHEIKAFSFANVTAVELSLSNNKIRKLQHNSFSTMKHLTSMNLDKNEITEINRNVFEELPLLSKLYLTSNKITTIHDRAFAHLMNLKELELDNNSIFSLNSETFYGLTNLQRLELSSNALEVIGDDTFAYLVNLKYLNLDGNKIQILDPGAFRGLARLQRLSLALNKLSVLDEDSLFVGLAMLSSLSLRENKLRYLKANVMAPILSNFYSATSKFEFQDNEFPCDCGLDWFLSLRNRTENDSLKLAIENLNCHPDPKISEAWKNLNENDRNNGEIVEDGQSHNQTNDYEYYDESQLDGKLFYIDVRDLLKCNVKTDNVETVSSSERVAASSSLIPEVVFQPTPTTEMKTTVTQPTAVPKYKTTKLMNRGVLDLSDDEPKTLVIPNKISAENTIQDEKKHFTTNSVITVSAKPDKSQKMYEEREMAADEAVPAKMKAHHKVHAENYSKDSDNFNTSNSTISCNFSIVLLLLLSLIVHYLKQFC